LNLLRILKTLRRISLQSSTIGNKKDGNKVLTSFPVQNISTHKHC
jgi:hypothetical protein